jgi:hypothetical protein
MVFRASVQTAVVEVNALATLLPENGGASRVSESPPPVPEVIATVVSQPSLWSASSSMIETIEFLSSVSAG